MGRVSAMGWNPYILLCCSGHNMQKKELHLRVVHVSTLADSPRWGSIAPTARGVTMPSFKKCNVTYFHYAYKQFIILVNQSICIVSVV
jgi:hypothetical protein